MTRRLKKERRAQLEAERVAMVASLPAGSTQRDDEPSQEPLRPSYAPPRLEHIAAYGYDFER